MKKNREENELEDQPNNPLHGVKLQEMLDYLVAERGWEDLGMSTGIRVFTSNPTMKSSLKFLRKTPWAREKIEILYLEAFKRN